MPLFRRNDAQAKPQDGTAGRDAFVAAVAPQAVEVGADRLFFPKGVLVPLTVREAGTVGDSRRPITMLSAGELIRHFPTFYSATFRRELPDTLRGSLRARRTLFEGLLLALADKTGRRPSLAEQGLDHALDVAESALARGEPAFTVALLLALFTPDDAAEQVRRELEARLRARNLLPQRFHYVADRALLTLQPGGPLFHGIEEHTLLLHEAVQLLPEPHRPVPPAPDAMRLGWHATSRREVFFSFTRGFDPTAPQPPHATTLLLGEPGSGKTTLMRLMLLQRLLQGRAVVSLDPEGENNRLCEQMGGVVIPATPPTDGESCLLHPLVAGDVAELFRAARFLVTVVGGGELPPTGATAALHEAVQRLWARHSRRVESGAVHVRVVELVEALELVSAQVPGASQVAATLRPYAQGGILEGFFDRERARLSVDVAPGSWLNFDLSGLSAESRTVVHALLTWFFHHAVTVGKHPMDVFIDEGWRLLREGPFTDLLDELGRRARKRGIGVVLATHLPADLARQATALSLTATAFVGRIAPDDAFAFFRSLGVAESEARERAATVSTLPPRLFLAVPAGMRSALFPVAVQLPEAWLALIEKLGVFRGMVGRG